MRSEATVAASSVPDVSHSLLPPSYVFLPSPSRPLLVLVLIGSAFSHYWWLISYCLCLSFPFSRRWHNMSDNYFICFYVFIFIKNIVSVSPYWCFLGNSISTYPIPVPVSTRWSQSNSFTAAPGLSFIKRAARCT
jgi:hypothetical protein